MEPWAWIKENLIAVQPKYYTVKGPRAAFRQIVNKNEDIPVGRIDMWHKPLWLEAATTRGVRHRALLMNHRI